MLQTYLLVAHMVSADHNAFYVANYWLRSAWDIKLQFSNQTLKP